MEIVGSILECCTGGLVLTIVVIIVVIAESIGNEKRKTTIFKVPLGWLCIRIEDLLTTLAISWFRCKYPFLFLETEETKPLQITHKGGNHAKKFNA